MDRQPKSTFPQSLEQEAKNICLYFTTVGGDSPSFDTGPARVVRFSPSRAGLGPLAGPAADSCGRVMPLSGQGIQQGGTCARRRAAPWAGIGLAVAPFDGDAGQFLQDLYLGLCTQPAEAGVASLLETLGRQ